MIPRLFSLAILIASISGISLLGRNSGIGGSGDVLLGLILAGIAIAIWSLVLVAGRRPPTRGPDWGVIGLGIESILVLFSAFGYWTGWSRAAGETYLTTVGIYAALNWEQIARVLRPKRE